jgi:predicted RNA-binding Zn ribbon-like protein
VRIRALASGALAHVRPCSAKTCEWFFLDTSKNHQRRWCDNDALRESREGAEILCAEEKRLLAASS